MPSLPIATLAAEPDPEVSRLLDAALAKAWNAEKDLPWDAPYDPEAIDLPEAGCLIRDVPAFRAMDAARARSARMREMAWALSNLVYGEERGAVLAAQTVVDMCEERPGDVQYMSMIALEEGRHFRALGRYLRDKVGQVYGPAQATTRLFGDLLKHPSWELKILVGQVIFEMTACMTLSSMFMRSTEPLLADLVRLVLRDESRHVAYSYRVAGALIAGQSPEERKELEDMLFESIVACVGGFFPVPVWKEEGLDVVECKRHAAESLAKSGILDLYRRVLPQRLAKHGFPSERLTAFVENELPGRLVAGGDEPWSS